MLLTVGRYDKLSVKISEITGININKLLYFLCHSSSISGLVKVSWTKVSA